jgi:hypothetical protein
MKYKIFGVAWFLVGLSAGVWLPLEINPAGMGGMFVGAVCGWVGADLIWGEHK